MDLEGIALSGIFLLVTLYSSIAVSVKRCHDRDHSGWFLLRGLVPILNLWPFIERGFVAGTERAQPVRGAGVAES